MSQALTEKQIEYITAGVPAMEQAGDAFLKEFYTTMIDENPSLLNIFNRTHQRTLDQPRAITRAVLMYAKNIDNLGNLSPLVERIVQKHVSLQVQPELYPVVGKYLLKAIEKQFGPKVATREFLEAWGVAYNRLADILIGAEHKAYDINKEAVGGWSGYRKFEVVEKKEETPNVTSFKLVPVDGKKTIIPQPGQYLGFKFEIPTAESELSTRQYSISEFVKPLFSGARGYRVSIKRIPGGLVSNHWHSKVEVGTVIDVSAPAGDFVLRKNPTSRYSVLFITAGIGITPAISMSKRALLSGLKVGLLQCDRNEESLPFKDYFKELSKKYSEDEQFVHQVYLSKRNRLTKEELLKILDTLDLRRADVYVIGPKGFMADVKDWIKSSPRETHDHAVYYDFFGPSQWEDKPEAE